MGLKKVDEITLKIKGSIEEFIKILEEKGFKVADEFLLDDTYFIPVTLDIASMTVREILSYAVLIRDIEDYTDKTKTKKITYKMKKIDEEGNILEQSSINCDITNIEDAKKLLTAIGYRPIMRIKENDVVYEKDGYEIVVKDVENGEKLIEVESDEKFDSIDKLIQKILEYELPVYTDNYFVKKAEIELEKVLNK